MPYYVHDGIRRKYNQLIQNGNFASTSNWNVQNATFSVSGNKASITASAQNGRIYQFLSSAMIAGHKYFVTANISSHLTLRIYDGVHSKFIGSSQLPLVIVSDYNYTTIWLYDDRASDWTTETAQDVMFVDLTDIYGSGNEPTTVDQFLADYPEFQNYVAYTTEGYFAPLSVKKYVIKDNNKSMNIGG